MWREGGSHLPKVLTAHHWAAQTEVMNSKEDQGNDGQMDSCLVGTVMGPTDSATHQAVQPRTLAVSTLQHLSRSL